MELRSSEIFSIIYHDIFDYPLTFFELKKWKLNKSIGTKKVIVKKNSFYFLKEREEIIKKRLKRKKYSEDKFKIAKKVSLILGKIPTIKLVAITGALAMNNADKGSDIDLMIITKNNTLWTTRLISYLLINIYGFKVRKPKDNNQKDKLCLNMWLDEEDLVWKNENRNIYSSHEIAQIIPLINKDNTHEKLLNKNSWILDFWPSAVKLNKNFKFKKVKSSKSFSFIEKLAFNLQYVYMKNKISREVITSTRAIFHPNDWSQVIASKLTS
jgi:predicted nucleotidyltransferase